MFNKRIAEIQGLLDNSDLIYYDFYHNKSHDQLNEMKTRLFRELEIAKKLKKMDSIDDIKGTIHRIDLVQELQMLVKELERIDKEEDGDDPVRGYTLV
jgi:glucose-6-phosphate isomerase